MVAGTIAYFEITRYISICYLLTYADIYVNPQPAVILYLTLCNLNNAAKRSVRTLDVCGCACPRTPLITQSSFVTEFQVNIELCFPSFQCPRSTSFRFLQKSDLDWDIS